MNKWKVECICTSYIMGRPNALYVWSPCNYIMLNNIYIPQSILTILPLSLTLNMTALSFMVTVDRRLRLLDKM